ncbi:hypothetical protein M9980_10710 [Sphingomonas donggukensis]|uniref:Repeat protein (TIGR03806 family) n=1 Tax=Sphingomonas donggukensis TaxID=2949093 RepID=A0ABY4TRL1_9SPHN|nr:SO2930 family diheme c-type cytochrome [Sphingomonas donggukensis]URW75029.1 hypothetical protein M9980_10710 [Sphingomonas donggukensis]
MFDHKSTSPAKAGAQSGDVATGPRLSPGKWLAAIVSGGCLIVVLAAATTDARRVDDAAILADGYPPTLSAFRFFTDIKARTPATHVTAYALNTPLFSDYAEKQRYMYVPAGKTARYDASAVLDFPVGSALIKTFGYGAGAAFRPIETRLLLRRASGWVAIPYVWNADLSDAVLKRSGTRVPVSFTDPSGQARTISYAVPNQNQCKDCHALSGAITPIGPTARNLNDGARLQALVAAKLLDRAPAGAPRLARWDDAAAPVEARARAYLEVNCAHCHNARGAASNSGLWLDWQQADAVARGIGKRPVAAGRGSGGRDFDIDLGHPERSILTYRMESTEPGVAMPELGRATVHAEGVALLNGWIAGMQSTRK